MQEAVRCHITSVDRLHTHSSSEQQGRLPHLERDPLVLSGFTEGMSEEEDVIHSDTQSQEGEHL